MVGSQHSFIYVKNNEGQLSGYISMQEIRQTLLDFDALKNLLIASDVANPGVVKIHENDNLDFVMRQFGRTEMDELPVISNRNGEEEVIGTIWQRDVIEAYNHQIFLRDMSGETEQSFQNLKKKKTVHVVDRYHFSELEAPTAFFGKTLLSINLRNKFDLELLLIKRQDKARAGQHATYIQPGGKTKIEMNDVLLVFGAKDKIDYLNKI